MASVAPWIVGPWEFPLGERERSTVYPGRSGDGFRRGVRIGGHSHTWVGGCVVGVEEKICRQTLCRQMSCEAISRGLAKVVFRGTGLSCGLVMTLR